MPKIQQEKTTMTTITLTDDRHSAKKETIKGACKAGWHFLECQQLFYVAITMESDMVFLVR